jgi:hypothetical protein
MISPLFFRGHFEFEIYQVKQEISGVAEKMAEGLPSDPAATCYTRAKQTGSTAVR